MTHCAILMVAGPTAAGKSSYAAHLAQKRGGVVINADALQIYAGLPLLSAQPSPTVQHNTPHALYGVVMPPALSSAGHWRDAAIQTIKKTVTEGQTPILTGGTGLYFRALMGGLADIPSIPIDVRERATTLYDTLGEETFRQHLAIRDPDSAQRYAKNDRQRLVRAYEVIDHTGHPLSYWQQQGRPTTTFHVPAPHLSDIFGFTPVFEPHLIMPDRTELYTLCDTRAAAMFAHGAIEEVETFCKTHPQLSEDHPIFKTIGAREIIAFLQGQITRCEALTRTQQYTRNYAKRQMTWFRNQWPVHPIDRPS